MNYYTTQANTANVQKYKYSEQSPQEVAQTDHGMEDVHYAVCYTGMISINFVNIRAVKNSVVKKKLLKTPPYM